MFELRYDKIIYCARGVFVRENVNCNNAQTRNLHRKYDHATTGNLSENYFYVIFYLLLRA